MSRVYYKNGAIMKEENYTNGILSGPVTELFKSGKPKFKGTYVDGNLDGQVEYFHPNGARKILGTYEFAVQVKAWRHYDTNGKVKYIEFYKQGQMLWRKTPEELRKQNEEKKATQDSLNLAPQQKQ